MQDNTQIGAMPYSRSPRPWLQYLVAALLLLCVGTVVFRDFIVGNGILLYRDIGRDSFHSYYTDFVHLSNYLRSDGFPSWSFHIGMGQDMAYATGFLLLEPVSWLPAAWIAHALVYQHLLKLLVAGLLFFRYLQLRDTPLPAALLGSLVIAFSAYMTLGSCWYLPAEELLAFTAILLGAETALQRGRWLWLALAVAVVGMINPFYLYLCALFLCAYVPARLLSKEGWKPGLILKPAFLLAVIAVLGVALGAAITLPYLNVVLNSPRGSGATNNLALFASVPLFRLQSAVHYITALLRPVANDFLGTGDAFHGWQNYFEAPQTYCGLICVLLFPLALSGGRLRDRVILLAFVLFLIIPTIFPWFRYLFWLFKGDYYRTYSLFCVLGLVTISVIVLGRYLQGTFNVWLLLTWGGILVGGLYLPIEVWQSLIDPDLRMAVTGYLLFYVTVLVIGRLARKETIAAYVVLAATAIELAHFNHITVSRRDFVTKTELTAGMAANRATIAALHDLKRANDSFFRLTTLRSGPNGAEVDSNEPMLLNYYGTSSYGSFNDNNYIRFLAAVEAIPSYRETDTRFTTGLTGNFVLSLFAGEKYALAEDPEPYQKASQYELVQSYENSYLFRNAFSIPFGLGFTRYLMESEFLEIPREGKEQVLLAVAVLDPESLKSVQGLTPVSAADLEKELAASSFPAIVQQRRSSALYPRSFTQNKVVGDVRLDHDGVLVLQMPFNAGWHAFQDDSPIPVVRVDAGLLGLPIKAGEHKIELRYCNPWLWIGTIISAATALLLLFARWRWPRISGVTSAG